MTTLEPQPLPPARARAVLTTLLKVFAALVVTLVVGELMTPVV